MKVVNIWFTFAFIFCNSFAICLSQFLVVHSLLFIDYCNVSTFEKNKTNKLVSGQKFCFLVIVNHHTFYALGLKGLPGASVMGLCIHLSVCQSVRLSLILSRLHIQ